MKRITLILIIAFSTITLNAKTWKIVGKALDSDTTTLVQDAANPTIYKYVGKLKAQSFKLFDGTDNYIPVCGMNDPFEQQVGMEKQTFESQPGFKSSFVNPNSLYRISLTDGTAPKVITEKVVPFDKIYLIGGPVNTHDPNWLLGDARQLEKDPSNPFIFYYRGFLKYNTFGDERGSIKFLTSNSSWDPGFHPVGTSNVLLSQASKMRLGGSDTKWEIPANGSGNGYYVIKLNTLDETIQVEQFQPANVDYPNNVYITGDAMPCGWVNGDPMVMSPTNILEGKYTWTGNVVPGQFKFLKTRGSWGSCYVSTIENQPIVYGTNYPIVFEPDYISLGGNDYKFAITEAQRCVFTLDLAAMKIQVNKESENSTENTKFSNEVEIKSVNGKIIVNSSTTEKKHFSVLTIDGKEVYKNTFISKTEIKLPQGYYIVKVNNTYNNLCKKVSLIN